MDIESSCFLTKINTAKSIVAISNFEYSNEIERLTKNYDCVIRFNSGSNEIILKSYENLYNCKTDVCVLSGYTNGFFGPIEAFQNKCILFSRPKMEEKLLYRLNKIAVDENILKKINSITNNVSFIPIEIFYNFIRKYNYKHPTTGLITLFYIRSYLKKNIDAINFYPDIGNFFNFFLKGSYRDNPHNLKVEKNIIKDLEINNIYI